MKQIWRKWLLPILHFALILLFYATPWLIRWQFVLLIFVLYRLQFIIFKQCVLSKAEFGAADDTFVYHYLKKIFPSINKTAVDLSIDYIIPIIVVVTAFFIQH